jgi:hypothetical protein
MIMRFVVPVIAAAALGLPAASALAAQSGANASSAAMQTCNQLEQQVANVLPEAIPTMVKQATDERAEGAKLCQSGKTEQGIATLERALNDAMYRG